MQNKEKACLMTYQAFQLNNLKKLWMLKERNAKIAWSIKKSTEENVDKTQFSKQRKSYFKENQSNVQERTPVFKTKERE